MVNETMQDTEWVIVIARRGWMGRVPYTEPIGVLQGAYATRAEAEAALPQDSNALCYWPKQRMWVRDLVEVPR